MSVARQPTPGDCRLGTAARENHRRALVSGLYPGRAKRSRARGERPSHAGLFGMSDLAEDGNATCISGAVAGRNRARAAGRIAEGGHGGQPALLDAVGELLEALESTLTVRTYAPPTELDREGDVVASLRSFRSRSRPVPVRPRQGPSGELSPATNASGRGSTRRARSSPDPVAMRGRPEGRPP